MLPVVKLPITLVELPVLKKSIKLRAFRMHNEKNALLAQEAGSQDDVLLALTDIIDSCIDDDTVKIDELPIQDLLKIFIATVSLSKGSVKEFTCTCKNETEPEKPCGKSFEYFIDLADTKFVTKDENFPMLYEIGNIKIEFKYPSWKTIYDFSKSKDVNEVEAFIIMVSEMIVAVYDGDIVYNQFDKTELIEWIKQLPSDAKFYDYISSLIDNVAEPKLEFTITCPECSNKETYSYSGVEDFFTLLSQV